MHFYLIRHGESLKNLEGDDEVAGKRSDSPLTLHGVAQVRALTEWLPSYTPTIHAFYVSSMRRAQQTAQPIAEVYNQEIITDHRLRDFGGNRSDGSPYPLDALPTRNSYGLQVGKNPYGKFANDPDGESYMDMRRRTALFLEEMTEKHVNRNIMVVTHSGTFNTILDTIFNVGTYRRCAATPPLASVTHIEHRPHRPYEVWMLRNFGVTVP